jgi:hypothetical protein
LGFVKWVGFEYLGVFFDDDFVYHGVIAVDILCAGKWSAQRVWCEHLTFV